MIFSPVLALYIYINIVGNIFFGGDPAPTEKPKSSFWGKETYLGDANDRRGCHAPTVAHNRLKTENVNLHIRVM